MATTDEELAAKQQAVADLRAKVAEARAAQVDREQEAANDVTARALDQEAVELESQLAEIEAAGQRSLVNASVQEQDAAIAADIQSVDATGGAYVAPDPVVPTGTVDPVVPTGTTGSRGATSSTSLVIPTGVTSTTGATGTTDTSGGK